MGATRESNRSNDFAWRGRPIAIKSGPGPVITRAMLGRVEAIVFADTTWRPWVLHEIDPEVYENVSTPSRSRGHTENYRRVSLTRIRAHGRRIGEIP